MQGSQGSGCAACPAGSSCKQPQHSTAAASPREINGITCPETEITITAPADLTTAANAVNTTYILGEGKYTISDGMLVYDSRCYIAAAGAQVTLTPDATLSGGNVFDVGSLGSLGLQGVVLKGRPDGSRAISVDGRLSAEGLIITGFTGGAIYNNGDETATPGNILLTSSKILDNVGPEIFPCSSGRVLLQEVSVRECQRYAA